MGYPFCLVWKDLLKILDEDLRGKFKFYLSAGTQSEDKQHQASNDHTFQGIGNLLAISWIGDALYPTPERRGKMVDGLYKTGKCGLLFIHLSIEDFPEILLKWVEKNRFYRFIFLIVAIVFTPARGGAYLYPVGRLVTGA